MHNEQIENKIKTAYEELTPPLSDELKERVKNEKGQVMVLPKKKPVRNYRRAAALLAAGLILAIGLGSVGTYRVNKAVAAVVSLEVNPSVEIKVNHKEKVLTVKPLNVDGEKIIGDMDFSGSTLEVTINALIGSMLQKGYLSEMANSILISVDDKNAEKGAALQQKLTAEVNDMLKNQAFSASVMSQRVAADDELVALAKKYNISVGKAQLIKDICRVYPEKNFSELCDLSINELNLILCGKKTADRLELDDKLVVKGQASEQAYIGESKAKKIALRHAGIETNNIYDYEWDFDSDDGVLVYEIEFKSGGYEYDYEINAVNGSIIKSEKEYCDTEISSDSQQKTDNKTDKTVGEQLLSPAQAKSIALNHAKLKAADITEYKCETDTDDGSSIYEIEFKSGGYEYDYEINAVNGNIIKSEKEYCDTEISSDSQQKTDNKTDKTVGEQLLSPAQAKSIALNHAKLKAADITEYKCETDTDDGFSIYEIEFKSGGYEYDYEINAVNGSIIKSEKKADD